MPGRAEHFLCKRELYRLFGVEESLVAFLAEQLLGVRPGMGSTSADSLADVVLRLFVCCFFFVLFFFFFMFFISSVCWVRVLQEIPMEPHLTRIAWTLR